MGDTNLVYMYIYLVIHTRLSTDRIHEGIVRLLNVGVPEDHVGPSQPAGRGVADSVTWQDDPPPVLDPNAFLASTLRTPLPWLSLWSW